jgi:hypothetical protein
MPEQGSMQRPTRHVCIATGQNLANLIPCLQLGATEVVILETPGMREAAGNLKRALKHRGIAVHCIPFDDASPEAIISSAEKIASSNLGEEPLVFNTTGGNKLMTLAITREMKALANEPHLVYADTANDRLVWLAPMPAVELMKDTLNLNDILLAQGFRVIDRSDEAHREPEVKHRAELTRRMADGAATYGTFFGTLNSLADKALNEGKQPFKDHQELNSTPVGRNVQLLEHAQRLNLLRWNRAKEIVFTDDKAAKYIRGGWLEEYVWLKLRGTKSPDFWAVDVAVRSVAQDTPNQFDALIAHRNRLLVIECKTGKFDRNDQKDVSYIYKLAQLADKTGGKMSRKLLLSAREIKVELQQRATEYEIDVLSGEKVKGLADYIRNWMIG